MSRILHIIDSLNIGGAEMLLKGVVKSLDQHDHTIVCLKEGNAFGDELKDQSIHILGYSNKLHLFRAVKKLKKIIRQNEIDLIHSHLLTATWIARLACPKRIPLLFSVHSILSQDAFQDSTLAYYIEKWFYEKRHTALFVSEEARKDYAQKIGIQGEHHVLPNFIEDDYFDQSRAKSNFQINPPIKFVAVGKLKEPKNYPFLIKALAQLDKEFILDIYGDGWKRGELTELVNQLGLENKIQFKGNQQDIFKELGQYDLFLMASSHEGFGIAMVEAMAVGLPSLVSNIPAFRQIGGEDWIYFNPDSKEDFIAKLNKLIESEEKRITLSKKGRNRAMELSHKDRYMKNLSGIYEKLLQ